MADGYSDLEYKPQRIRKGGALKTEFLTADSIGRAISRLMSEYDEFHWAVAWGGFTPLAKELFTYAAKFRNVTFGISFCQTDPNLVDAFVGRDNCYIATKFAGGTYHPKVYCFRSGQRVAAVIGSANFTRGGTAANCEAAVELTGTVNDQALSDLLAFTKRSVGYGEPVTEELAAKYRLSYKRAARVPKLPRDPIEGAPSTSVRLLNSALVSMRWDQYTQAVRSSAHHDVVDSLALLRIAQGWLSSVSSFEHLTTPQRKALAGVLGEYQKLDEELHRDWGWFGSMRGMGDFANRVEENDTFLARAVDSIPAKGAVTRDHYERFADLFVQAFRNSDRVGGVPTASRLLAMKRPDVFLCISRPNIKNAAREMAFAKSTLALDNYWNRVVEAIRSTDWYNSDKPTGGEGELWEGRAAMLDAILYEPESS